jgi:hypothetical protein
MVRQSALAAARYSALAAGAVVGVGVVVCGTTVVVLVDLLEPPLLHDAEITTAATASDARRRVATTDEVIRTSSSCPTPKRYL